MKKEWNRPTVSDLAVSETRETECPYRSGDAVTFNMLTAEQCCPCTEPGLATCTKTWKYTGACKS